MPIPSDDVGGFRQKRLEKPNRSRVSQKYASNWADVRCGSDSVHSAMSAQWPVYPRKRSFVCVFEMSWSLCSARNEPTTGKARIQSRAITQNPLDPKCAKSHPDKTVKTAVAPPTPKRP